jgi:hypothetical protein
MWGKRARGGVPRPGLALALLAILLAAGCSAGPGSQTHATTPGPIAGAAPFLVTDLGAGGPEPVVRVAADGRVVVAAQDPEGGGPRVWSAKDGKTFEMSRIDAPGGGEVDLAISSKAIFVSQLSTTGNVISISRDGGATWQTSPLGPVTQYFDREWLGVDAADLVYVVARPQGGNSLSQVSRSDNDGLTFLPQGDPWDAAHEPGLTNGNLVAWSGGLSMSYVCRDGAGVCIATSKDKGVTWARAVARAGATDASHVYAALAATRAGLVVTWSEEVDDALAIFSSFSSDGAAWSAPARISATTQSAIEPWPAARASAQWIVYLATETKLASADDKLADGARWTPYAVRIDERGAPVEASRALTSTPVHVGAVSPPVARGGGAVFNRMFGDFFTAAVDARGKLVVATEADTGRDSASRTWLLREP